MPGEPASSEERQAFNLAMQMVNVFSQPPVLFTLNQVVMRKHENTGPDHRNQVAAMATTIHSEVPLPEFEKVIDHLTSIVYHEKNPLTPTYGQCCNWIGKFCMLASYDMDRAVDFFLAGGKNQVPYFFEGVHQMFWELAGQAMDEQTNEGILALGILRESIRVLYLHLWPENTINNEYVKVRGNDEMPVQM